MATKKTTKKQEPVAEAGQSKRKRKQLDQEEERVEQVIADELADAGVVVDQEQPEMIAEETASIPAEVPVVPPNELLVFRDDGSLEPATQADLEKIGTEILRNLFAKPEVKEVLVVQTEKPPAPKLQQNHCRLCNFFVGDDPRGPLWANGGKCSAQWPQAPVEPEFYCNRFIFNEGLRDNN